MAKTTDNIPAWQFNVIPGNANQGAILLTRKDITNPPFNQDDFIWKAMEDIIGVANMKLEYDEEENLYRLYKAKGHRDNEGNWTYDWEFVGDWAALTEEVVDILRLLNYVEYIYDTSVPNTLKVTGVNKDGTRDLLCDIHFASTQYVDNAVNGVQTNLDNEITRATAREDGLEEMIKKARPLPGVATDTTADSTNGTKINVRYNKGLEVNNNNQLDVKIDEDTIKEDSNGDLYADNVRDNLNTSDKYTYSIDKIKSLLTSSMIYMGSVATQADLPNNYTLSDRGKVWNVLDTGENFAWTGTEWDPLGGMYVEGNGIKIQDNEISARIDGSKGLGFDSQHRLYTNIDTNKGLQFQSNGKLKAKIDTDKGLQFDSTDGSIEVKLGAGLEFDTNGKIKNKHSVTELFSGSGSDRANNSTLKTYTLSDNISNYDFLIVQVGSLYQTIVSTTQATLNIRAGRDWYINADGYPSSYNFTIASSLSGNTIRETALSLNYQSLNDWPTSITPSTFSWRSNQVSFYNGTWHGNYDSTTTAPAIFVISSITKVYGVKLSN